MKTQNAIPARRQENSAQLVSLRRIRFVCPFCRRTYARSLSLVRLGPGVQKCSHCLRTFADGSIEWPAATQQQKREFLFPDRGRFYLMGELVLGGILLAAEAKQSRGSDFAFLLTWTACLAVLPLAMRLAFCWYQIRGSIIRHQRQQLVQAGYAPSAASEAWPK